MCVSSSLIDSRVCAQGFLLQRCGVSGAKENDVRHLSYRASFCECELLSMLRESTLAAVRA